MTKERRAFLLQFLKSISKDTQVGILEKNILQTIKDNNFATSEMEKKELIQEIEKKLFILETLFLEFSDLVKYQYFNYGLLAQNIENNYKTEYTPIKLIEVLPLENY